MIYDRTQDDVNAAIDIIKSTKSAADLTDEQKEQLERGTLTIHTLNRIENKQQELKELFNSLGYWNTDITTRNWDYTDLFKQSDFDRIIANLKVLKKAFFAYKSTPDIPGTNYRKYQTINDVEGILHDLEQMTEYVRNSFIECGTFECGET